MELLKRIDEQLMTWSTARPYGYKVEGRKHIRLIILLAISASFSTLDVLMYGWSVVNVPGILLLWPAAFYEWRLWLRLRDKEEKQ
jgi:hypothetical protein